MVQMPPTVEPMRLPRWQWVRGMRRFPYWGMGVLLFSQRMDDALPYWTPGAYEVRWWRWCLALRWGRSEWLLYFWRTLRGDQVPWHQVRAGDGQTKE